MLKTWHDAVVECGENPRHLLAAAFVNLGNNMLASELIPENLFQGNITKWYKFKANQMKMQKKNDIPVLVLVKIYLCVAKWFSRQHRITKS